MKSIDATATAPRRGRAGRHWPLIIVALLLGHVLLMVVACTIAVRDKTFAVVPDYYGKALNWDQFKAAKLASEKLGWQVEVQPGLKVDRKGLRTVSFVLTDTKGAAIPGAALEADYFHHSHADQTQHVHLTSDAGDPRRFTAKLPMPYEGNWEFHFSVTAAGQTFISSTTQYLSNE